MRLTRFETVDSERPLVGALVDSEVVEFEQRLSVNDLLALTELPEPGGAWYPLDAVTLLAPVVPRCVFGVGLNYRAHIEESGKEAPVEPEIFCKGPNTVAATRAPISRRGSDQLDYEGELAVVIGAGGRVAGYAVGNDVSARDWQWGDGQWWRAKGSDGFCPLGPWITTVDEALAPDAMRLRTWVNGDPRQDTSVGDLLFDVDEIVEWILAAVALRPGDVVLTGTPSGVGAAMDPQVWLRPGDVVRVEIDGLGAIENEVVA
jgi:2-keto-4-pentenoate hydratase/2-oxohepta-3-ene-1,7-dioic acid hydratase in catechol pathway